MREVHGGPGPFNRQGEFPAEQSGDLPLSPTPEAFYRTGPSMWQQYTSFWLSSLLNRIGFFVIPWPGLLGMALARDFRQCKCERPTSTLAI